MATRKIQTGDSVKIIAGSHKGITGTVAALYTKKRKNGSMVTRVVVSGTPMVTAYQRAFKAAGMAGQMYTKDRTVDISNVSLVDAEGKLSKVSVQKTSKGVDRVLKTTGKTVVKAKPEKKADPKQEKKEDKTKKTK